MNRPFAVSRTVNGSERLCLSAGFGIGRAGGAYRLNFELAVIAPFDRAFSSELVQPVLPTAQLPTPLAQADALSRRNCYRLLATQNPRG